MISASSNSRSPIYLWSGCMVELNISIWIPLSIMLEPYINIGNYNYKSLSAETGLFLGCKTGNTWLLDLEKTFETKAYCSSVLKIWNRWRVSSSFWFDNWHNMGRLIDIWEERGQQHLGIPRNAIVFNASNLWGWNNRRCHDPGSGPPWRDYALCLLPLRLGSQTLGYGGGDLRFSNTNSLRNIHRSWSGTPQTVYHDIRLSGYPTMSLDTITSHGWLSEIAYRRETELEFGDQCKVAPYAENLMKHETTYSTRAHTASLFGLRLAGLLSGELSHRTGPIPFNPSSKIDAPNMTTSS